MVSPIYGQYGRQRAAACAQPATTMAPQAEDRRGRREGACGPALLVLCPLGLHSTSHDGYYALLAVEALLAL